MTTVPMRRCASSSSTGRHVPTVTEWLTTHIDSLTGVQPATIALPHLRRPRRGSGVRVYAGLGGHLDHDRALGEAAWRQRQDHLEQARFLSGAFNAGVRAGVMASNPCQGRRLPHTRVEETVF